MITRSVGSSFIPHPSSFVRSIIAVCIAISSATAIAQAYPSKPIRLIIPFPPGAPSDMVARVLGQKLSEQTGAAVVPENRAGAGGNVGLTAAAKSPPDGYTLVLSTPSIAISPSLYSRLDYDPARDFAPVARVSQIPNVMVVHPSVPARTLKEFIALARAHPGKLNFGSGGPGTTNHLANELLKHQEKINMVHVPYKGATAGMMAMISGEVDQVILPAATAIPQIRAGKVRPLAALSESRLLALPEVPTAKEAGLDNFVVTVWYGMFAPGRTPVDIVGRVSREILKALDSADVREKFAAMDVEPWPGQPQQLESLVRTETARYAAVIKSIGLKLD
jgi:tripartite-type tricarboxylate transporter receptor subunit TctC